MPGVVAWGLQVTGYYAFAAAFLGVFFDPPPILSHCKRFPKFSRQTALRQSGGSTAHGHWQADHYEGFVEGDRSGHGMRCMLQGVCVCAVPHPWARCLTGAVYPMPQFAPESRCLATLWGTYTQTDLCFDGFRWSWHGGVQGWFEGGDCVGGSESRRW